MYTPELIKSIARDTGHSQKVVREIVHQLFSTILISVEKDEKVSIKHFGRFFSKVRVKRNSFGRGDDYSVKRIDFSEAQFTKQFLNKKV